MPGLKKADASATYCGAKFVWCQPCGWIGLASELLLEHWDERDRWLCPRCEGGAGLWPIGDPATQRAVWRGAGFTRLVARLDTAIDKAERTRRTHVTPLVERRHRRGRRKAELTCHCDAAPYPHRAGSVEGCYGLAFCEHGIPTSEHPDFSGRCPECERWEHADHWYDTHRC